MLAINFPHCWDCREKTAYFYIMLSKFFYGYDFRFPFKPVFSYGNCSVLRFSLLPSHLSESSLSRLSCLSGGSSSGSSPQASDCHVPLSETHIHAIMILFSLFLQFAPPNNLVREPVFHYCCVSSSLSPAFFWVGLGSELKALCFPGRALPLEPQSQPFLV